MLLVTHNLGIVAESCGRVAVMYAGRIVEQGDAHDVFAAPAHPYTRELLRSMISLETTELHSIPGAPPNLIDPPPGCRFHPRCPDAMQVCRERVPIERNLSGNRRVQCWLHGPEMRSRKGARHRSIGRRSRLRTRPEPGSGTVAVPDDAALVSVRHLQTYYAIRGSFVTIWLPFPSGGKRER